MLHYAAWPSKAEHAAVGELELARVLYIERDAAVGLQHCNAHAFEGMEQVIAQTHVCDVQVKVRVVVQKVEVHERLLPWSCASVEEAKTKTLEIRNCEANGGSSEVHAHVLHLFERHGVDFLGTAWYTEEVGPVIGTAFLASLVWQLGVDNLVERNDGAFGCTTNMIWTVSEGATTSCYTTAPMRSQVYH